MPQGEVIQAPIQVTEVKTPLKIAEVKSAAPNLQLADALESQNDGGLKTHHSIQTLANASINTKRLSKDQSRQSQNVQEEIPQNQTEIIREIEGPLQQINRAYQEFSNTPQTDRAKLTSISQNLVRLLADHQDAIRRSLQDDSKTCKETLNMLSGCLTETDYPDLAVESTAIIKKNSRVLKKLLQDQQIDPSLAWKAISIVGDTLSSDSASDRRWGLKFLSQHLDRAEEICKQEASSGEFKDYEYIFGGLLSRMVRAEMTLLSQRSKNSIEETPVIKKLRDIIFDPTSGDININVVQRLFDRDTGEWTLGRKFIQEYLSRFGINSPRVVDAWLTADFGEPQRRAVRLNLQAINTLELTRPGVTRILFEKFGIKHFARYPAEMLLDQIDQENMNDRPFGLLVSADADHNGAFYNTKSTKDLYNSLAKGPGGKYYVRAFEVASSLELAKTLLKTEKKYGDLHKIAFLVAHAHGTEGELLFGPDIFAKLQRLNQDLTESSIAVNSQRFFTKHPTILLDSCSTGAIGGIGQSLSKSLEALVIGPQHPIASTGLEIKLDGDNIFFKPSYTTESSIAGLWEQENTTRKGLAVYDRGELVNTEQYLSNHFSTTSTV